MAPEGTKRHELSLSATPPPRKLNVERFTESRAPELEALHSIISDRLNNDFRSQRSKRRRTTSHQKSAAKKRRFGVDNNRDASNLWNVKKEKVSRKVRRRIELKMNFEEGFSNSGDGTKRLRTHVWHAKRFMMTKLWGFHLPHGLQGRGMGSRALLKRFKNGVLVHDASYYAAVQLEGPEERLISILQMVMDPSPRSRSQDIHRSVVAGVIYDGAMLHHVGAPASSSIAPVTYMWRPCCLHNRNDDAREHTGDGGKRLEETERSSTFRQLWVWLHPSAFTEGYDALKSACQREMDEMGISVNCFSLDGHLAKLEVMGSKAFQLLQDILHPISCTSENIWRLKKHSVVDNENQSQFKTSSISENVEHISSRGITSLTVKDPRMLREETNIEVPESSYISKLGYLPVSDAKDCTALEGKSSRNEELPLSLYSRMEGHSILPGNNELWDASSRVSPPVEDGVLCRERHHLRMNHFCLDDLCSGTLKTSSKTQPLRICPILLLKGNDRKGFPVRWSIILPLSWVRAFWIPLVSKGACAIGLREKHWIASEVGLPLFPLDFPDCKAYSCFLANQAAAADRKAELCPPLTRPFKIPIPPPWDCVQVSLDIGPRIVEYSQISTQRNMVTGNSQSSSDCINSSTLLSGCGISSGRIVARTSCMLINFLNEIHGDHLLLFPKVQNGKPGLLEFMKDKSMFGRNGNVIDPLSNGGKLCFVRVLLHAFKEGVFEEGAVVCAPFLSDITLWTSSGHGLQLPESAVRRYFKERSSTVWELNEPEDSIARECHRWPIGFITSGFVRGSKKPCAEGFCDAVLLAHLREQQWKAKPTKRKKEIYVLVRNLRASAYRLALATIVLEQQEEDVEFM